MKYWQVKMDRKPWNLVLKPSTSVSNFSLAGLVTALHLEGKLGWYFSGLFPQRRRQLTAIFPFWFLWPTLDSKLPKNWMNKQRTAAETFFLSITLRLRTPAQVVRACHRHQFCCYYFCSMGVLQWLEDIQLSPCFCSRLSMFLFVLLCTACVKNGRRLWWNGVNI